MKLINKILYISAILVIILIIGYIAFSFTNISTNIKQDYFVNTHFKATNNTEYIKFGDFTNTTLCYQGRIYDMEQVTYQDGIFKMIDEDYEEEYLVVVIDKERIYLQNKNLYLFRVS